MFARYYAKCPYARVISMHRRLLRAALRALHGRRALLLQGRRSPSAVLVRASHMEHYIRRHCAQYYHKALNIRNTLHIQHQITAIRTLCIYRSKSQGHRTNQIPKQRLKRTPIPASSPQLSVTWAAGLTLLTGPLVHLPRVHACLVQDHVRRSVRAFARVATHAV